MAWLAETSLDESEASLPSLKQLNRGVIRSVADAFVVALQRCVPNPVPNPNPHPTRIATRIWPSAGLGTMRSQRVQHARIHGIRLMTNSTVMRSPLMLAAC